MRAVVQRVSEANVRAEGEKTGTIGQRLLILLGIETQDTAEDCAWLARKIASLRVFSDNDGLMNLDIHDVNGGLLVVSQFTLHAKTKKGTRPSFVYAAKPDQAIPLYKQFLEDLKAESCREIATGEFGANMEVSLVNDGPVTILIDTKRKE